MTDTYELRHVEQRLAEDDRTAELNVHVQERGGRLFVRGPVSSEERRHAVLAVVRELCPGCEVVDELSATDSTLGHEPDHVEEIR